MATPLTIKEWLQGKVGVTLTNEVLRTAMWSANINDDDAPMCAVSPEQADLALAEIYWWVASQPYTKNKVEDSDGQWKHIDGGYIMSEQDKRWYRDEANRIWRRWNKEIKKQATVKLINL